MPIYLPDSLKHTVECLFICKRFSRKTRPKLPILDGIMDAVSNGLTKKETKSRLEFSKSVNTKFKKRFRCAIWVWKGDK